MSQREVSSASIKKTSSRSVKSISSAKKVAQSSAVMKILRQSPVKLANSARRQPQKKDSTREALVVLPHSMSIRAREKALVLLQATVADFKSVAPKTIYTIGLCFILFGGSISLLSAGFFPVVQKQLAQVLETTNTVSTTTTTTTNSTSQKLPAPVYTVLTQLPEEIHGTAEASFTLTYVDAVEIRLYNLETGKLTSVNYVKSSDLYSFKVSQSNLPSGKYVATITARALADATIHTFRTNQFFVPPLTLTSNTVGTASTTTSVTATTTTATSPTSSTTADEKLEIKVRVPSGTLTGNAIIKAVAPAGASGVSFYIRALNTTTLSPLGSANKAVDYWYFLFNTVNKTNGEYEIVAKTKINDFYLVSVPVRVKISNEGVVAPTLEESETAPAPIAQPTPTSPTPTTYSVENESVTTPTKPLQQPTTIQKVAERAFADTAPAAIVSEERTIQPLSNETRDILALHRAELSELFNRYAVAIQSDNQLTIRLAQRELDAARANIIANAKKNPELEGLASRIDLELTSQMDVVKDRVTVFEKLRRNSEKSDTHTDSDADGVSDFDEINLYKTNSRQADTDQDGFLDGAEIMRGFDPLSTEAQVPVVYELPQESLGVVQEELLKVHDVKPLIKHDEQSSVEEVQAQVRGTALPNSYVTLYIFSTPVVVTIKTDKDGSFVYNFENELEDGEHEVYVAVTDNTGAIVARSNPFKFVKEAQAFTPIDVAQAEATDSESLSDYKLLNMYNVVIGLGVLAFGLVLLMLGIGIRKKGTVETIITS